MAVYLNRSVMCFYNRFCQRQPKTNPLRVLRITAPVKPLENMVQILRMDAAAIILYSNLDNRSRYPPFYAYTAALSGMLNIRSSSCSESRENSCIDAIPSASSCISPI